MKKTLAILLALIMASSVALVSCKKDEGDTNDDNDDDFVVDLATTRLTEKRINPPKTAQVRIPMVPAKMKIRTL